MSDAIWHPKRVTHVKSYVMHLNVWLTISHMIDDAIKGNKGIKKKKKKIIIIIIKIIIIIIIITIIINKKKNKSQNGKGRTEGDAWRG